MAILKIKDKGVWKEIQAIKGDTGHDVYIGDKSKTPSEAKLIIEPVKGTATGTDIQVTDSVNDRVSKLVLDGKSTQETRSGKNLFDISKVVSNWNSSTNIGVRNNNDGTLTVSTPSTSSSVQALAPNKLSDYCPSLQVGDKVYITATTTGTQKYVYLTTSASVWTYGTLRTITQNDLDSAILWYSSGISATATISDIMISTSGGEYEPYGASPSPDYPSEIENVKGKNLFKPTLATRVSNGITCTANRDGTYTLNGTATAHATFTIGADRNLTVGKTYKLVGCPNGGSNTTYRMSWNYHGYEYGNGLISKKTTEARDVQITIFKGITASNLIFKPMFTENTSSTYNDYVPYGNIQIVETGKNLFDKNSVLRGYELKAATGNVSSNANWYTSDYIKVEQNSIYYISGNKTAGKNICRYDDNFNYINFQGGVITGLIETRSASYIRFNGLLTELDNNIQLEKGSIATDYEPYKEEVVNIDLKGNELCSLPNGTKNELIVKDGRAKIIKRIGKVVLDGSDDESWTKRNDGDGISTISFNYNISNIGTINQMNNRFQKGTSSTDGTEYLGIPSQLIQIYIQIKRNRLSTLDVTGFKAWLSTHNTIVQYELREPYEIDLGEVSTLTTYEGTSNITNSEDTNMSIEYDTNKTNLYYQNNGNIIKMNGINQ